MSGPDSTSTSRYVVGWTVADRENSALAGDPAELPEAFRGASQCTSQLLADLGDFEAQFKTYPGGSKRRPPCRC